MKRVLAIPIHSKYMICVWESGKQVYSHALCIVAIENDAGFALLHSTFHEQWVRLRSSSLGETLRYTPSKCFDTFPFPQSTANLDDIGSNYNTHRSSITQTRREGLTTIYNRFHDPLEEAADIVRLRELHREMDEAVARAYGWNDLRLDHGFHETKQGLRYTISEEARREVLDRLLLLNHQRHAEEVAAGLFEQKGGKKSVKSANGKQGAKATQGKQVLATGHTSERGGNGTQRNGQNGGNVEDKENNIIEGMAQDSLF